MREQQINTLDTTGFCGREKPGRRHCERSLDIRCILHGRKPLVSLKIPSQMLEREWCIPEEFDRDIHQAALWIHKWVLLRPVVVMMSVDPPVIV